ncbi:MAG: hypothetical protein LBR52_01585 [Prevotellaceae bacterium]|jgi:hypothetical protein|nr:hypothetical protein [Prevotellaceae bacterium]
MSDKNTLFQKLTEKRRILSQQLKNPAAAGFWNMVVDKYSDQAHFIYELLQNADDTKATEVRIILSEDHMQFIHNGTVPFGISDPDKEGEHAHIGHLNAITSIGASTKQDGNTIGKFGVGFKSVFQYTDTPHVEDDSFSFRIVDYIVPEEEKPASSDRKKGETLFLIPFKNPASAFSDIENKLSTLHKPLLFLRTLREINWETSRNTHGFYSKEQEQREVPQPEIPVQYTFVSLKKAMGEELQAEYLHTFTRNLSSSSACETAQSGTIAFFASEKGTLLTEQPAEPAFCFFPTKEATGLNMMLNAPFLLTDSRESIKQGEAWNKNCIDKLALLAADSIEQLCRMGKIDDNLFEIIPTEKNVFFRKEKSEWKPAHLFYPFYIRFLEKLSSAPVFLSCEGHYLNRKHTRYATEKSISNLFSSARLAELLDNPDELTKEWSFCSLYTGSRNEKNEQIRKSLQYIKENELIASLISPEYIARHISGSFIKNQPVEWLQSFYTFLGTQKTMLEILHCKPFILCANGEVAAPFSSENDAVPRVYLSGGRDNSFPSVHPDLLENEKSRRFFEEQAGLTHPDLLAEIELFILPRYRRGEIEAPDTETIYRHLNDFTECFSAFSFQEEKRSAFLQLFQNVPFLPAFDSSGKLSLQPASAVYFDTPALRCFLQHYPEAYFLDNSLIEKGFVPEKREVFYRFLTLLGVSFHARIKKVERPPKKEVQAGLKLAPKSLRRYDKGAQKITDREIEGFAAFLANVTPESSQAFTRLLAKAIQEQGSFMYRLSLEGEYQYIEKSQQTYTIEKIKETTACQDIFNQKWLFGKDGKLVSVRDIQSTEELSEVYDRSHPDLFFFLGIAHDPVLAGLNPAQRKAISIVRELEEKGISIEMLESLVKNPGLAEAWRAASLQEHQQK